MSDGISIPESEETPAPQAKKDGLPLWVVIVVLAVCLLVVYFVYNKMTGPTVHEFKTVKHGSATP